MYTNIYIYIHKYIYTYIILSGYVVTSKKIEQRISWDHFFAQKPI